MKYKIWKGHRKNNKTCKVCNKLIDNRSFRCRNHRIITNKTKEKISKRNKGHVPTYHPSKEKNHFWKGGITPLNKLIRTSTEYKLWRKAVFERDNYTCIWCGLKGYLNADHIKPFALYPELRFAIDNGRTLCINCHKNTSTYAGRIFRK